MSVERQKELLDRLKKFAKDCAKYVSALPKNDVNRNHGYQLVKSSSSMPANYAESMCSLTRQDWLYDVNKCRKEANESEVWLDLLTDANELNKVEGKRLHGESKELVLLFSSTIKTARENEKKRLQK